MYKKVELSIYQIELLIQMVNLINSDSSLNNALKNASFLLHFSENDFHLLLSSLEAIKMKLIAAK